MLDFTDATRNSNLPEYAGGNFADRIAAEVRYTGAYSEISRETVEGSSLVVSGDVTRYAEGFMEAAAKKVAEELVKAKRLE